MELLSKSEFAALMGWSKPYVSKLNKQGRLVLAGDGRVDVAATQTLLNESADPSKAGVAERHQRDRVEKGVGAHVTPTPPVTEPAPPAVPPGFDVHQARAPRGVFQAQQAAPIPAPTNADSDSGVLPSGACR